MGRLVYSYSPSQQKTTQLSDVVRDLYRDRDIRRERRLAQQRPSRQASMKDHEEFQLQFEERLK